MARTKFIDNLQQNINLDADLSGDNSLNVLDNIKKIVLLNGENGTDEFIKDEVDITYFRAVKNEELGEYTDDDNNSGYKLAFNFGREDFAGDIKTVCLANKDFIDPRFSNSFSNSAGNTVSGSGGAYTFSANDMINNYTRVIDVDVESGKILTFNVKYDNGTWKAAFTRWNHDFKNFRIGGMTSYIYLDSVVSVNINGLITLPDGVGGWNIAPENTEALLYFGIDEESDKYILTYLAKDEKVFNNLLIDKNNMTTELHKMVLPNEVSWPINLDFDEPDQNNGYFSPRYSLIYKSRFCMPLYTVRIEHEEEINGVYMCSINPKNSTDITALETHCLDINGDEVDWDISHPSKIGQPLIYSGCGSAIACAWTIKNNVAYIKGNIGTVIDIGFYYQSMIIHTKIENNQIIMWWKTCPYCLSITETLTKPFLKTLNNTLKYTFRVVNTGR